MKKKENKRRIKIKTKEDSEVNIKINILRNTKSNKSTEEKQIKSKQRARNGIRRMRNNNKQ